MLLDWAPVLIVWSAFDNLWRLMNAYDSLWQLLTAFDNLYLTPYKLSSFQDLVVGLVQACPLSWINLTYCAINKLKHFGEIGQNSYGRNVYYWTRNNYYLGVAYPGPHPPHDAILKASKEWLNLNHNEAGWGANRSCLYEELEIPLQHFWQGYTGIKITWHHHVYF